MKHLLIALACLLVLPSHSLAQETLVVAGAGPSTQITSLFFESFAARPEASGYSFVVPPESIKHAGGLQHAADHLFGRSGRPLNEMEQHLDLEEIFLAMVPISFTTGREVRINELSMRELEMVFKKQITNWKILGGPDAEIVTVGREPTEALFSELKRDYTFFNRAEFDVILHRDDEVLSLLKSPQGWYAISFGARPNLAGLHEVMIAEDLRSGVRLGLVYNRRNQNHPLVSAVRAYAQSAEWRKLVQKSGAYPVK